VKLKLKSKQATKRSWPATARQSPYIRVITPQAFSTPGLEWHCENGQTSILGQAEESIGHEKKTGPLLTHNHRADISPCRRLQSASAGRRNCVKNPHADP
jgi:hypothetical protein